MQRVKPACPPSDWWTFSFPRRGDARTAAWFHPATRRTADARPFGRGGVHLCHSHGSRAGAPARELRHVQAGLAAVEYALSRPPHGAEPEPRLLRPAGTRQASRVGDARPGADDGPGSGRRLAAAGRWTAQI